MNLLPHNCAHTFIEMTLYYFYSQNAPFIQVKSNDNGEPLVGNDRFEGFCVDMIKILAERCNFTYLLRQQAHKQYGAKRDNGSWDGMIGELIRGVSILLYEYVLKVNFHKSHQMAINIFFYIIISHKYVIISHINIFKSETCNISYIYICIQTCHYLTYIV